MCLCDERTQVRGRLYRLATGLGALMHDVTDKPNKKSSCFQLLLLRHWHFTHGSVATHLRCGGIFSYNIITNVLLILRVKQVWKSVNIWRSWGVQNSVPIFGGHPVCLNLSEPEKMLRLTALAYPEGRLGGFNPPPPLNLPKTFCIVCLQYILSKPCSCDH